MTLETGRVCALSLCPVAAFWVNVLQPVSVCRSNTASAEWHLLPELLIQIRLLFFPAGGRGRRATSLPPQAKEQGEGKRRAWGQPGGSGGLQGEEVVNFPGNKKQLVSSWRVTDSQGTVGLTAASGHHISTVLSSPSPLTPLLLLTGYSVSFPSLVFTHFRPSGQTMVF